jgi:hypothetical protein
MHATIVISLSLSKRILRLNHSVQEGGDVLASVTGVTSLDEVGELSVGPSTCRERKPSPKRQEQHNQSTRFANTVK